MLKPRIRKQPWHSTYKPDIMRGGPLIHNATPSVRYYAILQNLIHRMTHETEMEIRHLFRGDAAEEYFAMDANVSSQAKTLTNALAAKFDKLFASNSKPIAEQVANETDRNSKISLQSSIQKFAGEITLTGNVLQAVAPELRTAIIAENVGLIKSIPSQYLDEVQGAVMRSITTGNGLQDLVPFLARHKEITLTRARLIAKDQTSKAYSAINRNRLMALGLDEYEWRHSAGGHEPRPLHQHVLNGTIQKFSDPPVIQEAKGKQPEIRGYPGQLIHCRCFAVPIMRFGKE